MSKKLDDSPHQVSRLAMIEVAGYKSIGDKQQIELRPLTILCGANSSGKSSMMQPILLLKQTLEAGFDPGALLLDGPNVKFTQASQFLSTSMSVGLGLEKNGTVRVSFVRGTEPPVEVRETSLETNGDVRSLRLDTSPNEILDSIPKEFSRLFEKLGPSHDSIGQVKIVRNRCFLRAQVFVREDMPFLVLDPASVVEDPIRNLIHLPGLRGNPQRTYPITAVEGTFPGTFERYVASVIAQWQSSNEEGQIGSVSNDLAKLGLTWKVVAKRISDTEVELSVGRLPKASRGGAYDLVSIADVGFGVSQVLPLVIALRVAKKGQIVYVEQPELHLHPKAQVMLAEVLCDASSRGVSVVAETHSSLLLLAIQSLITEGKVSPELVKLHWFERTDAGVTKVTSADLDDSGRFGDWPQDFGDVELMAQARYLDALEAKRGSR